MTGDRHSADLLKIDQESESCSLALDRFVDPNFYREIEHSAPN